MPLKSTNIWDDIRGDRVEYDASNRHGRYRGVRPSLASYSVSRDDSAADLHASVNGSSHANRHGVSMKSLVKTRRKSSV